MLNRNAKLIQSIFVALEFVFGIGFAILGGHIFSFFDHGDIAVSVFNTFVVAFISMMVGVVMMGYFHYRTIDRLKEFGKAIGWCFLGLLIFLILYIVITALTFKLLPHYVSSVILPIVMPVAGAVIGMNYIIFREKNIDST
jgi:uncharacterized membrane-anchored protein